MAEPEDDYGGEDFEKESPKGKEQIRSVAPVEGHLGVGQLLSQASGKPLDDAASSVAASDALAQKVKGAENASTESVSESLVPNPKQKEESQGPSRTPFSEPATSDTIQIGVRVRIRRRGLTKYHLGTITSVNGDGTFSVQYDSSEVDDRVDPDLITCEKTLPPVDLSHKDGSSQAQARVAPSTESIKEEATREPPAQGASKESKGRTVTNFIEKVTGKPTGTTSLASVAKSLSNVVKATKASTSRSKSKTLEVSKPQPSRTRAFTKDPEDLLYRTAVLRKKKEALRQEIVRKKEQTALLRKENQTLKAQSSSPFPPKEKSVPSSHLKTPIELQERVLELSSQNAELTNQLKKLDSILAELQVKKTTAEEGLQKEQRAYSALSGQPVLSLVELEQDISKLLLSKQEIEKELHGRGLGTLEKMSTAQCEQNSLRLELEELQETLEHERQQLAEWKQKLRLEKLRVQPLLQRRQELEEQIRHFRGAKALLRTAFDRFDVDKDGNLNSDEVMKLLREITEPGSDIREADVKGYIEARDVDGSGTVSFDEFCKLFMRLVEKAESSAR